MGGHGRGEPAGLVVERIVGLGAGRPEDGELPLDPVRREHVEGVAHLLERGVRDLEVAAVGAVTSQADRGHDQLEDEVGVLGAGLLDELRDRSVELAVPGAIAGAVVRSAGHALTVLAPSQAPALPHRRGRRLPLRNGSRQSRCRCG